LRAAACLHFALRNSIHFVDVHSATAALIVNFVLASDELQSAGKPAMLLD